MKKFISLSLLISLITLSTIVGNPDGTDKSTQQEQTAPTKKDIAKISASLLGSAFLGYAAFCMPYFVKKLDRGAYNKKSVELYFQPSNFIMYPCYAVFLAIEAITKQCLSQSNAEEATNIIAEGLPHQASCLSAIASFTLAKYGLPKLYRLLKIEIQKRKQKKLQAL